MDEFHLPGIDRVVVQQVRPHGIGDGDEAVRPPFNIFEIFHPDIKADGVIQLVDVADHGGVEEFQELQGGTRRHGVDVDHVGSRDADGLPESSVPRLAPPAAYQRDPVQESSLADVGPEFPGEDPRRAQISEVVFQGADAAQEDRE